MAPAFVRGLCICVFTGFIYLGIVLAYFANYGAELNLGDNTYNQWLMPTSIYIMFVGIIFILLFIQYESPHYLVKCGQHKKAIENLSKIFDSITVYVSDLFKLLGIISNNESLLVSVIFGIIKLVVVIAFYIASFLSAVLEIDVNEDFKLPENKKGTSEGAIYLLTTKLFSLRIRALYTSMAITLYFANQYSNACGTFWCFVAITIIGNMWVWFSILEIASCSLESIDRLFALLWYKIGRYGNKDAKQRDQFIEDKIKMAAQSEGAVEHSERVNPVDLSRRV
ncbi:unnamed protein product [Penicillium salamii]|uniref:Uncharacterized protein n=1 Tax=Penicillium salamii TaxID=1612424 RepID=A0A9W4NWT4_9EURO|nr:unnamed protein product [Penicillium salamii]